MTQVEEAPFAPNKPAMELSTEITPEERVKLLAWVAAGAPAE